ncbi:MAG: FecR domain-containing protein [Planctomycetota bacterium]|nr:FecR domain-containing protein [Planctomycetota bacterium]
MRNLLRVCLIGIVLLVLVGVSFAQKDKTPAGKAVSQQQTKPKPMVVTVKEVSGTAHRLLAGKDEKWAPIKVGDKLDEMTVIRTGFRTKVVLTFADNSEVTIERATKMGIKQFRKEGKVTRTTLGLKYGSLRATVKKASGPNDFRIATPVATAAARGSRNLAKFSGDFGYEMKCLSGKWNVKKGAKSLNLVPGESTNNNLLASIKMLKKASTPVIGDVLGGLTPKELTYIRTYSGGQGGLGFTPGGSFAKTFIKSRVLLPTTKKISEPRPIVCVHGLDITIGD